MTVQGNSITTNYSTVPQASFINLFPEIVYDPSQAASDSLDIWSSAEINVFPKNTLANPYIVYRPNANDDLPNIARVFYGTDRLWWITLLINNVEDPFSYIQDVAVNGYNNGVINLLKKQYIQPILYQIKTIKAINDTLNALDPAT
jgi:hypothetical protein